MFFVTIFKLFITTDGNFRLKSNKIYIVFANKSKDYKLILLYKLFIG